MKNNKTCHLYTYIFLLVLSFFLFSFNVKADTISLTPSNISTEISTYITSDFYSFKTLLENDTSCMNNTNFMIFYYNNQYYAQCYQYVGTLQPSDTRIQITIPNNGIYYRYSNNSLVSVSSRPIGWLPFYDFSTNIMNYSYILYTTSSYQCGNSGYCSSKSYQFTYLGNTIYIDSTHTTPSLYDLSLMQPVEPPDSTPTLTAFYTLVIDKFSIITDFFIDNTYLFAILLIPIFILCIYLIKRSLIK